MVDARKTGTGNQESEIRHQRIAVPNRRFLPPFWRRVAIMGLLAIGAAVGCQQQCFLTECDYQHYHEQLGLPGDIESNPASTVVPSSSAFMRRPADVNNPERPVRYL